jgi:hypothetical protein
LERLERARAYRRLGEIADLSGDPVQAGGRRSASTFRRRGRWSASCCGTGFTFTPQTDDLGRALALSR